MPKFQRVLPLCPTCGRSEHVKQISQFSDGNATIRKYFCRDFGIAACNTDFVVRDEGLSTRKEEIKRLIQDLRNKVENFKLR